MLRQYVMEDFREFIRIDPRVPEGLRHSLKLEERTPKFIDKIVAEINLVEKAGVILDRQRIKMLTYDLTALFVHLLKTQADQMHMSDLQKQAVKFATEGDNLTNKLDDQGNGDLTEELGVIIKDKV